MKILVMPKPIDGVSREELLLHSAEEIQAAWQLYAQGICREFYTCVNEAGRVVLMLESESLETAREALATLPFVRSSNASDQRSYLSGTFLPANRSCV